MDDKTAILLKLARFARYVLFQISHTESVGQDAGKWRKAFHLLIQILQGVLTDKIPPERLDSLWKLELFKKYDNLNVSLDKSPISAKIKLGNPHTDGGAGSGNFGHSGRPGKVGGSASSGGGSSSGGKSKNATGGNKSSGVSGGGSGSSNAKKEAGGASSSSSKTSKNSAPKLSARGENAPCTGFASKALFERHVKRHIAEFPDMDGKQYEQYAIDFLKQPCSEVVDGYRTKQGEIVRFDRANGEYAKGVPGGRVVTCYVARFNKKTGMANLEAANRYFDRLKETEGVE